MGKFDLVGALNKLRAEELRSIAQYMNHHYMAQGMESPAVADLFKKLAMAEMKHAYKLAERIAQLGGEPVANPGNIARPKPLKEMIKRDLEEERSANDAIRAVIKQAGNDSTTRLMLEEILADGEEHAHELERLLE